MLTRRLPRLRFMALLSSPLRFASLRFATLLFATLLLVALTGCTVDREAPHPPRSGVSVQLDARGVSAASADDPDPTRVDFDDGGEAVLDYLTAYLGDPELRADPACPLAPRFAWPAAGMELWLPAPAAAPGAGADGLLVIADSGGPPAAAHPGLRDGASDLPVITARGGTVLGGTVSAEVRSAGPSDGFAVVVDPLGDDESGRSTGVVADVDEQYHVVRLRAPSGVAERRC